MMFGYLVRTAADVYKDEGLAGVTREFLKYTSLYGNPVMLAQHKLLSMIYPNGSVIRDVQGSKMLLRLGSGGIHADLFMYGYREPEATKVMHELLRPDMNVLDIGANIGYYALMEARACARVWAVEPGPDNYESLCANVRLNGYPNLTTHRLAIGDTEGYADFALNPKAPNWHRVAPPGQSGTVKVEMATLDGFWQRIGRPRIDLLRMDVEGYELNILRSGQGLLATHHPAMFIEVHRDHIKAYSGTARGLLEYLAQYGYGLTHAFVLARPGPTGKLSDLLADPRATHLLTEKGMATHLFFGAAT